MRYKVNAHDDALIGCKIHPFDRPWKIFSPDSIFCTTALCLMRLWHGLFMPNDFRDNRSYPATWSTFTPDGQHWWSTADGLRLRPQHQINNSQPLFSKLILQIYLFFLYDSKKFFIKYFSILLESFKNNFYFRFFVYFSKTKI